MALSSHIKPIFIFYHYCQLRQQLLTKLSERESVWWAAIVLAEERTKLESGSED